VDAGRCRCYTCAHARAHVALTGENISTWTETVARDCGRALKSQDGPGCGRTVSRELKDMGV
jgi:hypothetical protein